MQFSVEDKEAVRNQNAHLGFEERNNVNPENEAHNELFSDTNGYENEYHEYHNNRDDIETDIEKGGHLYLLPIA